MGVAGRSLADAVADPRAPLDALERRLTVRIGARWADGRVRRAVQALTGGAGLPAVAMEVGLGERQLERLFAERVGLGPKRFARVMRLQRALEAPADLATLALRAGYADASHVVREIRSLCGVTPGALLAERAAMSETSNLLARRHAIGGVRRA